VSGLASSAGEHGTSGRVTDELGYPPLVGDSEAVA
jgi:hypothetical protein